ncbi:caspase-8-like [Colossoma macropomum]|uniref:caspase-8-like n=1 Tax=Colossoma macropomum TaxID=42526 RepID=UPI001864E0BA|nr:caspase-8-like [Colossoma macropomum]XP_036425748.1 caspase-8-like [Colossoma macropomum]
MQTLRDKKLFFIDTLSADASFVLQHAEQNEIITKREYNNLNHPNHTQENIIINLLDKVMNKGNETCLRFLQLLQHEQLQDNFPGLKGHFRPPQPALNEDSPVKPPDEISEYKMSSVPRGLCVIINNIVFKQQSCNRIGSEDDEESLEKVFRWLGFTVEVHRDQTAQQMKDLLKQLSQKNHEGDCFVCCILSHGGGKGVHGTDGGVVPSEDIFTPFSGTSCQSLAGKPKVFFIQACRGKDYQRPVKVQADNLEGDEAAEEAVLETDVVEMFTIPDDADFFVARSTVKGFVSFRDILSGSWFIQSLCKQLETYCPKGEDIQSILLCVNEEVSKNVSFGPQEEVDGKQMPVQKVTLRKKLVFRVP